MLIAQDLLLLHLSGLTVDCQFGWDLEFFEDFGSMEFIFFLSEGLFEAFIRCETLLHSAFIFQIGKHITDAVCRAMYDCAWMKCSCIGFHFMLFCKFATFSPIHTLQACWCSLFLLCLRRYIFCLDTCLSHRILLFVLGNGTFLFEPLSIKHRAFRLCALDFTTLVLSINSTWIMKNY